MASPYTTNFHKDKGGNALKVGEDLMITIGDNPMFVSGALYKTNSIGRYEAIQLEQTGTPKNPENDSLTFEMKQKDGNSVIDIPPGKYMVKTKAYFEGKGELGWKDDFEIV